MDFARDAFGPDEPPTAPRDLSQDLTQVSGVHEAVTQPAPYVEELDDGMPAIGSIPTGSVAVTFDPVVELETGRAVAFDVLARSSTPGLERSEDLYARAALEGRVGELGRLVREQALQGGPGRPLFIPAHPTELKDGWLVRPDDPIGEHEQEVYLELRQTTLTPICRQVLDELSGRSGVGICLGEFGSQVSSVEMLLDLKPTYVKAAASLLQGTPDDQRRMRTLYRLVQLCQDLGATLVATGIRDDRQRRAVMRCGIRLGQGPSLATPAGTTRR